MSGAGTERAERELEEATGCARARASCARVVRSSSEPRSGWRGGGGAGECVRLARARDGLPSPTPSLILTPALGCHLPYSGQPSSSPCTSRPLTFLFAPPDDFPPMIDCHSGILFPGQGDLWGEGVVIGRGTPACCPHHGVLTRGRSARGPLAGKTLKPHIRPPQGN